MVVAARRGQGGKAQGEGLLLEHAVYVCMYACTYVLVCVCTVLCRWMQRGTAWHGMA